MDPGIVEAPPFDGASDSMLAWRAVAGR